MKGECGWREGKEEAGSGIEGGGGEGGVRRKVEGMEGEYGWKEGKEETVVE